MHQKIIFYLSFLLIIASCAGGSEKPTISSDASIRALKITADASGNFVIPATPSQSGNLFYFTVPLKADIKSLVFDFSIHEKATATIDDKDFIPGTTSVDCSETVTIKVVAEDGTKSYIDVLVKTGISDFDKKVYSFMNTFSIPGVSISVMKDNKVIYSHGFGYAVKETKVRTTPNHLFRLASVSKQFTTICALTLVDEGKFKLDDKVFGPDGILGEKYKDVTGTKAEVTVRNFLQH